MKNNISEITYFTIGSNIPKKLFINNNETYKLDDLLIEIENNANKINKTLDKNKYIYINNLKISLLWDAKEIIKNYNIVFYNCIFDNNYIPISGKKVHLINPIFSETAEIFIDSSNKLLNIYSNNKEALRIYKHNYSKNKLFINGQFYNLLIDVNGNDEISLSIVGNATITANTNILDLTSSKIFLKNSNIKCKKLKGESFVLKSYNPIIINNDAYFNDKEVQLTEKELKGNSILQARRKLLSVLKETSNNMNTIIDEKARIEKEKYHEYNKDDIAAYLEDIKALQEQINTLQEKEQTIIPQMKKRLLNTSIKKIKGE